MTGAAIIMTNSQQIPERKTIRVRVNLNELALNLSKNLCQIVAKQPKNLSQ
jgi:hypothetical protein